MPSGPRSAASHTNPNTNQVSGPSPLPTWGAIRRPTKHRGHGCGRSGAAVSANREKHVGAGAILLRPVGAAPHPEARRGRPRDEAAASARLEARKASGELWLVIEAGGGIDAWITAELRRKGLLEERDPSTLSDSEKTSFKANKKAEAAERRVLERRARSAFLATHVDHLGVGIHYQENPKDDDFDIADRALRAKNLGLEELVSPEVLAKALGVDIPRLRFLAFHRDVVECSHYHLWQIPKRDGTLRSIAAPKAYLKAAQRWILRNVAEKLPVHGSAHGFLPSRSIVSNAEIHAGAEVVVKIDVKDFFPTVTWKRVKGLFRKAGLPENVATLLALLTTEPPREIVEHRGRSLFVATGPRALPQGAPTSPALTNALCVRLDRRMSGLGRKLGFQYSRYADDLAFSFRQSREHHAAPIGALIATAEKILVSEGFALHGKKTAVFRRGASQRITGLVVNASPGAASPKARVPREVIRRVRAALHNREHGKPGKEGESLAQLQGLCAFIHMTDPVRGRALLDRVAALMARTP